MSFCLPKFAADVFKGKLQSGEINPEALLEMTSKERRDFFKGFLGEDSAKRVNALFESKLLLKNQQEGIINWAKQVTGIKPQVRNEIIDKVMKMDKILQPGDEALFLADLAARKLNLGVTMEEAQKITDLAKAVSANKNLEANGNYPIEYGRAKVAFDNYVQGLKTEAKSLSLRDRLNPTNFGKNLSDLSGTAKSIKASFDDSAIFRQGWKTLMTHPGTWLKNAAATFTDMVKTFGGQNVMDEIKAEIISRGNYDLYKKAKLAVGTVEEAYPTSLPEKIPVLGRAYKASETAYTGFVYKMRADVFDSYINLAKKSGVDISDPKELESIGQLVNSLTGRGSLGALEPVANVVNNVFFSPRNLKAQIDTLTHVFTGGKGSNFVRKQAAINLVKVVMGTAAVLTIANAIKPGSVETDPRSADFGKIKIGNTRFDVTGGIASIATLAARVITHHTKSSTTGKVSDLWSGKFGEPTGRDTVVDFLSNKLSPAASVVDQYFLEHKDFSGNKPTVAGEAMNFIAPLPLTNYLQNASDPHGANVLAAMIADGLGIGTNTYGAKGSTLSESDIKAYIDSLNQ